MEALGISLLFGAPWLVAIAWAWAHASHTDAVPQSLGARALQRLQTS